MRPSFFRVCCDVGRLAKSHAAAPASQEKLESATYMLIVSMASSMLVTAWTFKHDWRIFSLSRKESLYAGSQLHGGFCGSGRTMYRCSTIMTAPKSPSVTAFAFPSDLILFSSSPLDPSRE